MKIVQIIKSFHYIYSFLLTAVWALVIDEYLTG